MVRLHHLLISACVLQAASARAIRQQVPRRVGIPPTVADTEHAEALGVRRRQNAAEAGAGAGFCRKRVVKVDNSGSPNSTASVGEQKAPVSNSACIPGDVNCLPTITIGAAASTSYIDVTSTILVPAAPTSTSSPPPQHPSSSASKGLAPSNSSAAGCPVGYTWKRTTDNFATFDGEKWNYKSGTEDQVSFGPDGLVMKLTQQSSNIVFESQAKWTAPVSLSASIKTAQAGGIINCAIFGQAGTDEIDLELIEDTWQVPIWHNGKRLVKNQDVSWTLANTSLERASWVFEDHEVKPYSGLHNWTLHWDTDSLSWSADGKKLLIVKRVEGEAWPEQALPFRWGPWAADGGWAGQLNWSTTPEPEMQLKQVVIEGCQLNA